MSRASRLAAAMFASVLMTMPAASASGAGREEILAVPDAVGAEFVPAADVRDIRLRVPSGLAMNAIVNRMNQVGSIGVDVGVSRLNNGQVRVGQNLWGGKGLRFPAYTGTSSPPRAVVRVTHTARSGDPFAPQGNDFTFSIYFKKDATSTGTPVDNGDNLLQRGLASDPAQYKLEVDSGRPSCTVKGDRGQVIVTSSITVNPNLWYHASCARTGNTVRVQVKEYRGDGSTRTVTTSKNGTTGSLAWPKRETPISIGGKLAANGAVIRSATDQFNGWATHPVLEIKE